MAGRQRHVRQGKWGIVMVVNAWNLFGIGGAYEGIATIRWRLGQTVRVVRRGVERKIVGGVIFGLSFLADVRFHSVILKILIKKRGKARKALRA